MLNRTKLLISLAVPSVAAIIFAILWRRKNRDTPLDEKHQDKMVETEGLSSSGSKETIQETESSISEDGIANSSAQTENFEEEICEVLKSDAREIEEENSREQGQQEVDKEGLLKYEHEDEYLKHLDNSGDNKIISQDHRVGKKTSCCTIDSGVELPKQPSFDLKDYWLEETLSEGSGDSTALSSYAEPPLERYLASSCDVPESEKMIWEIEFPQILCGRLIGRKGKNVKVISDYSGAKIRLIPQSPGEVSTHRIISISGDCSQIKAALDSIHEKFPAVSLNRINGAASQVQNVIAPTVMPTIPIATPVPYVQTVLPNLANFNVVVTSVLDGNHFFIHLHNDTLQAQLQQLHETMLQCYGQGSGGPLALPLPHPIIVGAYCAAPAFTYDGWYRAQVLGPTGNGDEVQVKYLDYGGYGRIAASSLRQLRYGIIQIKTKLVVHVIIPSRLTTFLSQSPPVSTEKVM